MGRWLAVLLATGAVAGVAVAVAHEHEDAPGTPPRPPPAAHPLPAPDAALPRRPAGLAATLTTTTRRLQHALAAWDRADPVPRDVTYLALHHQRILRLMTGRRPLGDATLARLPRDVRGEARDTVFARRQLAAIPRRRAAAARARPAPRRRPSCAAATREAQHRFGVHWSVLAAVNFVESAFGRVRSASEAGAAAPCSSSRRPGAHTAWGATSTTRATRSSPPPTTSRLGRAATSRPRALRLQPLDLGTCARSAASPRRMRADESAFPTYYAWQVFVRTPSGIRRLTGPGRG